MQKRKTNKFGQKLGLALCMLPLSSWAISSATLDASPLPVVSFHETKDIEATAQVLENEPSPVPLPMLPTKHLSSEPTSY